MAVARPRHRGLVALGAMLALLIGIGLAVFAQPTARDAAGLLTSVLESRTKRPVINDWSAIRGAVVLGGEPARLAEALRLKRDHPSLRVVLSGASDYELSLIAKLEEPVRSQVVVERESWQAFRKTCGNAIFSRRLIAPKPGERWVLVTSALHMPRALGAFYEAGFAVEPWPVQRDTEPSLRLALHEWIGLIVYRLTGCSPAFLPYSAK